MCVTFIIQSAFKINADGMRLNMEIENLARSVWFSGLNITLIWCDKKSSPHLYAGSIPGTT